MGSRFMALLFHLRLGQKGAHFEDRDRGQEAQEQEHRRQEHADRTDESHPVPARGVVHAPGRVQEVATEADYDNDETLQPHAEQDDSGNEEMSKWAVAQASDPQQLWYEYVAGQQLQ